MRVEEMTKKDEGGKIYFKRHIAYENLLIKKIDEKYDNLNHQLRQQPKQFRPKWIRVD